MIDQRDGWLFLSHSNKDFESVCQIRNTLEKHGFQPITFFLKCITDENELEDLIKREIAARRWFVFVNSENSNESKWAKAELAYARELNKKIFEIDANGNYKAQLRDIFRRTTVFMSYSMHDKDIAKLILEELNNNDFQIRWHPSYQTDDWPKEMEKIIDTAGTCLLLMTENAVESHHVREESYRAFSKKHSTLVVMVGDVQLKNGLETFIPKLRQVRISNPPTKQELHDLIQKIIELQD